jgi:hypothetical protein
MTTKIAFNQIDGSTINVKDFGAVGDDSTDNSDAIDAAIAAAKLTRGRIFFPTTEPGQTIYRHSRPILIDGDDIVLEGETEAAALKYTGTGAGIKFQENWADPARLRCGLINLFLITATGDKTVDWTGSNYGKFHNLTIVNQFPSGSCLWAQGNNGAGPYYNSFDTITLGGSDGSQYGIDCVEDASIFSANGPNGNEFSNIRHGVFLSRFINIVAGVGNLFTNIHAESLFDEFIALNNVTSAVESGTITSHGTVSLTDTSKSWTNDEWIICAVIIENGPQQYVTRQVVSNTSDTLTLDKPWAGTPGTADYLIVRNKADNNKFVNCRLEGDVAPAPNFVRFYPGAINNEVSNFEVGSIGLGEIVKSNESEDTSNKALFGDTVYETFVVENPGASANVDVIPRSGVFGGFRTGSKMVLTSLDVTCLDYTAGSATVTADQGGTATGNGTVSVACDIDSVLTTQSHNTAKNKRPMSSANNPLHLNVTTDASFGATSDLIIVLGYQVI